MKTKTATKEIDNTAAELKSLIRDAEKILSETSDESGDQIVELRDRLKAMLRDGEERLEKVKEVAHKKMEYADEYVRSHPYHAVGLAAGVGAIIGLLASRRAA